MAEYQCFPVWDVTGPGPSANLELHRLSVSDDLRSELEAWARRFDDTLDAENPADSGFEDPQDHRSFVDDGWRLAQRLSEALGPDVVVAYFDDIERRLREVG